MPSRVARLFTMPNCKNSCDQNEWSPAVALSGTIQQLLSEALHDGTGDWWLNSRANGGLAGRVSSDQELNAASRVFRYRDALSPPARRS